MEIDIHQSRTVSIVPTYYIDIADVVTSGFSDCMFIIWRFDSSKVW